MRILAFALPFIYFSASWLIPWEKLASNSTYSPSYIFDIVFSIAVIAIFKIRFNFKLALDLASFVRLIVISFFSIGTIGLASALDLSFPFKYVDNLMVKLLIIAPILEELVFRGVFLKLFLRYIRPVQAVFLSSLMFSLSHIPAYWFLPAQFQVFVIYQAVYTFLLSWICSKALVQTKQILWPVLLHFTFNLFFYLYAA